MEIVRDGECDTSLSETRPKPQSILTGNRPQCFALERNEIFCAFYILRSVAQVRRQRGGGGGGGCVGCDRSPQRAEKVRMERIF